MQLLTIDEIISSIMEETEGLDAEITDGIVLSKKEIPIRTWNRVFRFGIFGAYFKLQLGEFRFSQLPVWIWR